MKNKNKLTIILQFVKFIMVGTVNTSITYMTYSILVALGLHEKIALIIQFCVGIPITYFLNKKFTFKDKQKKHIFMMFKLVLVYAPGLFVNYILLFLFIDMKIMEKIILFVKLDNILFETYKILFLNLNKQKIIKIISQFISLIIIVPISFGFQKYFVFRKKKKDEKIED